MDFSFNLKRTANASAWRVLPNRWDFVAFPLIICIIAMAAIGFHETLAPMSTLKTQAISLDPANLPEYALRTTLRMLLAMVASLIFTLIYGTLAAKSRRKDSYAAVRVWKSRYGDRNFFVFVPCWMSRSFQYDTRPSRKW